MPKYSKYYFGVYIDYIDKKRPRVAQLADCVDDLSCEMLADLGCITFYQFGKRAAWKQAKDIAIENSCTFIEQAMSPYKIIKLEKKKAT